ncbi:MAG TPA: UDP-N-acetylglucosamine 2-epimerase (non-hydrolyzing) [Opitutales bacterium]|jgi:UDP-N-acetylglucosamine 2-epimerase|nr:UDP-N-acetylglucosamine 2-epimerase (non-hydrolyzing) [Opitutales bacterium]
MSKKKIALVAGTRPEVIKLAPVYFALRDSAVLEPVLLSSGQHRQMLDQAFAVFGLKPDLDLNLMQPGQTLPDLTARVITNVSAALRELRPSALLTQGDTTTVLGAALAAFYERIPMGHVEAGLRTGNFDAPWPEEMNRRLADPISRWCFAPTDWSASNLRAEGIPPQNIHVTGNTVVDALLWVREKLRRLARSPADVAARCAIPKDFSQRYLETKSARFILITGHRRESFGQGFENICQAIAELARRHPDLGLLYPVHLNPNVQEPVNRLLGSNPRVALIPPVDYEDFIWLMDRCHCVLSDSGGVQEEAPSLGKPVLVMRETTERPEGVTAGTCRLVGTDPARILAEAVILLDNPSEYASRSRLQNPYGDGRASIRIREILEKSFS